MNTFHLLLARTILLCSLLLIGIPAWAKLTAHLDRERITEGESVRLIIEATGQVSSMPDTRELKRDFDVTGTMSGSRVNIVNGKMDSRTTWTITLIPLHSGELTIPPLTINGEQTPELTLHVSEAPSSADANSGADSDAPVFLETEVNKTDPYVQGMVSYTQRVFFSVNLAQGSLTEPEHENALVLKLGEDHEYVTRRNGQSYNVIERQFVIFPQTSGRMTIAAPVLNAQIPQNNNRHDPFFDRLFTNTRPIRLRGETVTLDVRPRPDHSQTSYWLPAESVELRETWQPDDNTVNLGEPVTRNITIQARGVTGEQLPEPKLSDPQGFKLYPDRAQAGTQNLQQNVLGEKTLRLAYMPTQPGKHTLPAFSIHWWDTENDSTQVATLPQRTITVLPGTGQGGGLPAPDFNNPNATDRPQTGFTPPFFQPDRPAGAGNIAGSGAVSNWGGWFWSTLLFAALWLITLLVFWRKRRYSGFGGFGGSDASAAEHDARLTSSKNARQARGAFLAACRYNNPRHARHYLLKWAAAHWPDAPPHGIAELAKRFDDPAVQSALKELDRVLYRTHETQWNGNELARLISALPKDTATTKTANDKALPDLYS